MLLKNNDQRCQSGFTLLEILIALFIFTILSTMLVGALHNVIGIQQRTAVHAERLHELQRGLLVFSLDVEQAVNRSILNTHGKEEPAFKGDARSFTFTHAGMANAEGRVRQTSLARSSYKLAANQLQRITWPVLDQAPNSKPHQRVLLTNISDARFEYLDKEGRFRSDWPIASKKDQVLPRAVRIIFTIPQWGRMSQLYVINAQ